MNTHLADVLCVSGSPLKGLFFRAVGGKRLPLLPGSNQPPLLNSQIAPSGVKATIQRRPYPNLCFPEGEERRGEDWRLDSSWTIKIALNNLSSVKHPSWRRPRREKESLCLRRHNGPFRDVRGLLQNSSDEDLGQKFESFEYPQIVTSPQGISVISGSVVAPFPWGKWPSWIS